MMRQPVIKKPCDGMLSGSDAPPVHSDEAALLVLHHLSLADMYFTSVDEEDYPKLLAWLAERFAFPHGRDAKLAASEAFVAALISEQKEFGDGI